MLQEFKQFISRGNVIDLAIGIVIGTAFTKIVNSLVTDIILPPVGMLLGKVDFSTLYVNLSNHPYSTYAAAKAAGAPLINYGMFINSVIDFFIVAFVIFLIIRQLNRFKKPAPTVVSQTKDCQYCLTQIPLQASRCPNCTSHLLLKP